MYTEPTDAVFGITYRCNARCLMCNIWQAEGTLGMDCNFYYCIPSTLKTINISGGEPFLRDDIEKIVRIIKLRCPDAQLIISTNGFMTERIKRKMSEIIEIDPDIGVGISIDGIGQMHDMIRGIPGAFDKALATLQAMQNLGIKNIRIGFTISNTNLNHLGKVYNLALEQGVDFGCAVAQNSELYFKTNNNSGIEDLPRLEEQFNYIISRQLRTANPKQWARAFFNYGTYQFSCGVGRLFDCKAGTDFFYMDPDGNIYPCNIMNKKMGNIRASDFNSIWNSQTSSDVRSLVAGCGKNCWMICTARTAIKKNFLKVGNWIVQNKIRSHLFNGKGIF